MKDTGPHKRSDEVVRHVSDQVNKVETHVGSCLPRQALRGQIQ